LAGSLILGFLDLQSSQAQNRFYTDLEDWLAGTVQEYSTEHPGTAMATPVMATPEGTEMRGAIEKLRTTVEDMGSNRATSTAMANLADAIQGLVAHMRTEQQMIREWADSQGEQNREIKKLLERIARQPEKN
jgi:phage-related tail fiber protein